MAWDAYSDNIRAMTFKAGGVFDLSGNPWTSFCDDNNVEFNPAEVKSIVQAMRDGPTGIEVNVNHKKQQIIIADDKTLVGKNKDESCIIAVGCKTCMLVGVGGEKSEPRQLLNKLMALGEHMANSGY